MKTVKFGKREKDGVIYYVCLGNAHVMGGDGCGRRVEIVDGGCRPQAPVQGRGWVRARSATPVELYALS